jgi:seryl-tRNA synthetase
MPVDRIYLRPENGGDIDKLILSETKRGGKKLDLLKELVDVDKECRKIEYDVSQLKKDINAIQKQIIERIKARENADDLINQKKSLDNTLPTMEENKKTKDAYLIHKLPQLGNFVHDSVIVSNNEDDNEIVKTWGENKELKYRHDELLYMIDGYNPDVGSKLMGHRGYVLKGDIVFLNQALINYGLHFLSDNAYEPLQPPVLMRKEPMSQTAQLEEFDEALYKVSGGTDEMYLIATSEQPISAYHADESLKDSDLPKRYAGYSSCFRKEAGSAGKQVRGIYRIHEFQKIEQFVVTSPEKSWEEHEKMIAISEKFYQSLNLPYRVINIVSGALNNAAAKKYDLEAWFPGEKRYNELVSASNCTDYQSRALNVRFKPNNKSDEKRPQFVHMLNATLCATERTICCILENYQTDEGINIPEVLIPYMRGKTSIPFVKK